MARVQKVSSALAEALRQIKRQSRRDNLAEYARRRSIANRRLKDEDPEEYERLLTIDTDKQREEEAAYAADDEYSDGDSVLSTESDDFLGNEDFAEPDRDSDEEFFVHISEKCALVQEFQNGILPEQLKVIIYLLCRYYYQMMVEYPTHINTFAYHMT